MKSFFQKDSDHEAKGHLGASVPSVASAKAYGGRTPRNGRRLGGEPSKHVTRRRYRQQLN